MEMEVFGGVVEDVNISLADADGGRMDSAHVDDGRNAVVVIRKKRAVSAVRGMVRSRGCFHGGNYYFW
ncbi:hypothetical protein ACHAXS_013773 [Conticribra weissflogii]